jgi:hypothetical protein
MDFGLNVGSIPNSETTGNGMEFYLFNTNGTFTKSEKEIRLKLPFRELTTTTQSDGISFNISQ